MAQSAIEYNDAALSKGDSSYCDTGCRAGNITLPAAVPTQGHSHDIELILGSYRLTLDARHSSNTIVASTSYQTKILKESIIITILHT